MVFPSLRSKDYANSALFCFVWIYFYGMNEALYINANQKKEEGKLYSNAVQNQ